MYIEYGLGNSPYIFFDFNGKFRFKIFSKGRFDLVAFKTMDFFTKSFIYTVNCNFSFDKITFSR